MDVRIYYEDTDCGGVVYHANYLKYFERARTHFLEERGTSVAELLAAGIQFLVVRADLAFRTPARYGQTLTIETTVAERKKASFTMAHLIRERESGRTVVEGSATLVSVDLAGNVVRLPQSVVGALMVPRRAAATDGSRSRRRHG
jgi:acyl-CoA thioester hydrolase